MPLTAVLEGAYKLSHYSLNKYLPPPHEQDHTIWINVPSSVQHLGQVASTVLLMPEKHSDNIPCVEMLAALIYLLLIS